jgi:tripartite-type tricarboxylate transporter receptor subunit TctC
MFLPVHVALQHVQAGKLRMLAAGGTTRASATPQVPSLAEATGIHNIDTDIWYGVYAPAGTPQPIVAKLNTAFNALLRNPEIAQTLEKQGLQPTGGTPDALGRTTREDLERWARVVRDAKIQPE